jgi:RNA polymerase sigma-70 factor (ECF subfamily)
LAHAAPAAARGRGGRRPARADRPDGRAQRDPRLGAGRAGAARRSGPLALGPCGDRRGCGARAGGVARPTARPLRTDAAIAAVHASAPSFEQTDWAEIVGLYDRLAEAWPSPVVALNRAAAIGLADGPQAGLLALDELSDEPALAAYRYLAAARADFLRRLGRGEEARAAYTQALALTENEVERAFLSDRLATLQP